jgi:hypothetical protein
MSDAVVPEHSGLLGFFSFPVRGKLKTNPVNPVDPV